MLRVGCLWLLAAEAGALECSLRATGGTGDRESSPDVTDALRRLLVKCAGRTITIPGGSFVTAPVNVSSDTILELSAGTVLYGSPHVEDYPRLPAPPSYGRSRDSDTVPEFTSERFHPLIFAFNASNVTLRGAGVINGSGDVWYPLRKTSQLTAGRPRLVEFMYGKNVVVEDLTLANSPFWTLHLLYCEDVRVSRLKVRNDPEVANTDGVDPDSSRNVLIEDCDIVCGDDAIAIKSGWDAPGEGMGLPVANVTVRNLVSNSITGIALGSEISGGLDGVLVENARMVAREYGVFVKTAETRGGYIRNAVIRDSYIDASAGKSALTVRRNYTSPNPANPDDYAPAPTSITGLSFVNVSGIAGRDNVGWLMGDERAPLGVDLVNVSFSGDSGWQCVGPVVGHTANVSPPPCVSPPLTPRVTFI